MKKIESFEESIEVMKSIMNFIKRLYGHPKYGTVIWHMSPKIEDTLKILIELKKIVKNDDINGKT